MTPRRLLPYLALFLVFLGLYFGLTWRQSRQEAQKIEAKKVFQVKEAEISQLGLKRGQEEVRLVNREGEWYLEKPLKMRADKIVVDSMLSTLAHLQRERGLESGEDLKPFGLDKPDLTVEFTGQGKGRRLVIGGATPGKRGYYAYQDQDSRHLLIINEGTKTSLDRPLAALRDKTIFAYSPDQAKSLSIKMEGAAPAQLERVAPGSWRWLGREKFPVRGDRVEELLRFLHTVKVKDFVADAPRDLTLYGLAPPRGEVTVAEDKKPESIWLGKAKGGDYVRKAPDGPVVLADKDLLGQITKTLATLEDRRLWRGQAAAVQRLVWGPPEKTWVGVKEKDFWKITGPEKQELRQPAVLLEVGLWKLQLLEFIRPAPPKATAGKPLYVLELEEGGGKPLFRLEELGPRGDKEVLLRLKVGDKTDTGLASRQVYQEWQEDMARLAAPPPGKPTGPGAAK